MLAAASEVDLHDQLQGAGLELLQCKAIVTKKGLFSNLANFSSVKTRDLIQVFIQMEQMQGAGVPLLEALSDIRETIEHGRLRDIMAEIHRDVSEGCSLSEAMSRHPKVFTSLYISLIAAAEETGDLRATYQQLIKYLKWSDYMQAKVRKATRYPITVAIVIVATITIMMTAVVPQIVGFIRNMKQAVPFYTSALMATSDFCVHYWWALILAPIAIFIAVKVARRMSDEIAYKLDLLMLNLPIVGILIRKINIARFAQTFGALFASGIDVLYALEAARKTVTNLALIDALENVQKQVHEGSPLSEAFQSSGEFSALIVRMLKVGEESGNLTAVLEQVSEFYTADIDEAIQGLISMIEPLLTAILGVMILWIAVAVFGPIYSSFDKVKM